MLLRRADTPITPAACAIAVMGKASFPGRTKTRLVPPLSFEEAAEFNTAFLRDISANLECAGHQADIAAYMAFGPPGAAVFFEETLSPKLGLIEVWLPNFGDCLFMAISEMLALGHTSVCVLNSDSPTLPTEFLIETARLLQAPGDRMVLGPSTDGGYYLLGLKQPHRQLFADIDWSTERVCGQTLERAAEIGLEVVLLPEWYDIDDHESLLTLSDELQRGQPFSMAGAQAFAAPASTALLQKITMRADAADRIGLPSGALISPR